MLQDRALNDTRGEGGGEQQESGYQAQGLSF
jgi:hypothetical protein